jgi:hypothetical protein
MLNHPKGLSNLTVISIFLHPQTQTELNEALNEDKINIDYEQILNVLHRNLSQIEEAIYENHRTRAFKSGWYLRFFPLK